MSRVDAAMRRAASRARLDNARAQPGGVSLDAFDAEGPVGSAPTADAAPMPVPVTAPAATAKPEPPSGRPSPAFRGPAGAAARNNPRLIVADQVSPFLAGQYRRLAAALHDLQQLRGLKVVMVSSAVPREGKSLTVSNVALALSEGYQRQTLLIDADLRRPAIHDMFGIAKSPGLTDLLGEAGPSRPLPLVRVSPWLSVLTAGQPTANPLAQLTSGRLRTVISDAAAHFDWILIDTPPVSLLPDAQHVASVAEGVVLVIAAGATHYQLIQRAVASLGPERMLGTLLNYADDRLLRQRGLYDRYYLASGNGG